MSWADEAACKDDRHIFLAPNWKAYIPLCRTVCMKCPVRTQCLDEAVEEEAALDKYPILSGAVYVRGGLTPEEREPRVRQLRSLMHQFTCWSCGGRFIGRLGTNPRKCFDCRPLELVHPSTND